MHHSILAVAAVVSAAGAVSAFDPDPAVAKKPQWGHGLTGTAAKAVARSEAEGPPNPIGLQRRSG